MYIKELSLNTALEYVARGKDLYYRKKGCDNVYLYKGGSISFEEIKDCTFLELINVENLPLWRTTEEMLGIASGFIRNRKGGDFTSLFFAEAFTSFGRYVGTLSLDPSGVLMWLEEDSSEISYEEKFKFNSNTNKYKWSIFVIKKGARKC